MTPQPPQPTPQNPDPSSLSHKQLKALAKASRPWYRKKRFWALGAVGLVVLITVANGGGSNGGSTSTKQNGGVSTLSNNDSHPPQADVAISKCSTDEIGLPNVELTITNHSTGRSNYMISVNLLDASGTKVGDGTAVSNNVDPGQVAIEKALASSNERTFATCKVVSVDRFASH
jgi:hypothetical protein